MQRVGDPSQNNVDNLNNVRRGASRHFTKKEKEYLKVEIEELENNSKIKNIRDLYRGINDFKKGYQPRTSIVKDDNGEFYIWVSVHHKPIIYIKPTRCNSGSIVFIINNKYALHVSDALCVHHQEHYKL